jgi:hypothetical protein
MYDIMYVEGSVHCTKHIAIPVQEMTAEPLPIDAKNLRGAAVVT